MSTIDTSRSYVIQGQTLQNICDAVKSKTGASTINVSDLADEIENIPTGGGGNAELPNDVNFYDYDGTIVYSYSASDFSNLSAMPTNPTHTGLTAQGWNWTLADAQSYVRDYGMLNIGQMYVTDDGKTRLYITIAAEGRMSPTIRWNQTVANGVTIDWGDGSSTETVSGTGNKTATHTYSTIGDYVITLNVASGTMYLGNNSQSNPVIGGANNTRVYGNMLKRVEIGNGVTNTGNSAFYHCYSLENITIPNSVTSMGPYLFQYCYSLASVTIPSGVTSIGTQAFSSCYSLSSTAIPKSVTNMGNNNIFYYCYSLSSIAIPSGVTSIGNSMFSNCQSLSSVTIPSGITSIGTQAFYCCWSLANIIIPSGLTSIVSSMFINCYSLASVTIPSGVTSIEKQAFYKCYGVAIYDFAKLSSVPTLSSTNAFSSIPSDCKIVVPDSLVSSWKTATNWSTYASYIIGESDYNA